MKNIVVIGISSILFHCLVLTCSAATVEGELTRISHEVAKLNLGFGDYVLGRELTASQKMTAATNEIKKALKGTYKFKDGEFFVIASRKTDVVIGLYQDYPDTTLKRLKPVIGSLMLLHGEPTAMAHNKMVYWTYNENGKIEQNTFDTERGSGGIQSLVTVKLSSSEPIIDKEEEEGEEKKISAYVMITSDPLSKLFLAQNNKAIQD